MGGGGSALAVLFFVGFVWVELACVPIRRFRPRDGVASWAHRAVITWLKVIVVVSVVTAVALSVSDPELGILWAIVAGPGALVAGGRLAAEAKHLRGSAVPDRSASG